MANYKKQSSTVKQGFTYKGNFYKKGSSFRAKKEIIEDLKFKNILK